jgi:putative PIN family toxin of toxin-antitoxin system
VKLVVDTNILVSGLLWRGAPAGLLEMLELRRASLVMSRDLIFELRDVLSRKKLAARIRQIGTSAPELAAKLARHVQIVNPSVIPQPSNLRDADDLQVLACAAAAKADVIVTGDKDLLVLKSFRGIPIMTVREVLERLKAP